MIGDVDPAAQKALDVLKEAFGDTLMHVNFGESEDAMRGFNTGYDDAEAGFPTHKDDAPLYEPFRSAYQRGYEDGWETWREQQEGVDQ